MSEQATDIVCVRCSQDVNGPEPGFTGVPVHTGHVDPTLDRTCGQWGYRVKRESERD